MAGFYMKCKNKLKWINMPEKDLEPIFVPEEILWKPVEPGSLDSIAQQIVTTCMLITLKISC